MYFNQNIQDTNLNPNLDDAIENNKEEEFKEEENSNKKRYLIIGAIVLAVVIIITVAIILLTKKNIELIGNSDVVIYQNDTYVDPGYVVKNIFGKEINKKATVTNNINNSVIGEYKVKYKIGLTKKERNVSVVTQKDKQEIFILNCGEKKVTKLKVGETYQEAGCNVLYSGNEDLTKKVEIYGNVNTKKAGTYIITYSVTNNAGITKSVEKTVIVED